LIKIEFRHAFQKWNVILSHHYFSNGSLKAGIKAKAPKLHIAINDASELISLITQLFFCFPQEGKNGRSLKSMETS